MKKKISIVLITILAIAVCLLCACKSTHDVKVTCETITARIGEQPDFASNVSVTVDGEAVENPEITATLESGDPSKAGTCTYTLTFVYEEQTYTGRATVIFYVANQAEDKVVITCNPITVAVNTDPDFASNVKITVNGQAVSNPQVTSQLKSGNLGVNGTCTYTISYEYNGQAYMLDVKVNFIADNVEFRSEVVYAVVGSAPDFSDKVTVSVNGDEVENPQFSSELVMGSATEAGVAVYKISYTYNNTPYDTLAFVRFAQTAFSLNDLTQDENTALNTILAKVIDKYDFMYLYEVPDDNSWIKELETADGLKYSVDYSHYINEKILDHYDEDNNPVFITELDEYELDYYLEFAANYASMRLYIKSSEEDKWYYHNLTAADEEIYGYLPYAFAISENNWDASFFQRLGDNLYSVKPAYLYSVAGDVMNIDEEQVGLITVKTDGEFVTELNIYYVATDDFEEQYLAVLTYAWSNIGQSEVTLPEAEEYVVSAEVPEDYVDPSLIQEITEDERANLAAAFNKTYDNLTFGYVIDRGEDNLVMTVNGKLAGDLGYCMYKESQMIYDWDYVATLLEYIYQKVDQSTNMYYLYDNDYVFAKARVYHCDTHGDISSSDVSDGKCTNCGADVTLRDRHFIELVNEDYYPVASMLLNSNWFGKIGNKFYIKGDSLAPAFTEMDKFFHFSNDNSFTQIEMSMCQLTLDDDNNVSEVYVILHGVVGSAEVYYTFRFTYGEFGTTQITLPTAKDLQDLTTEQTTEIESVLLGDYSNVTLTEGISGSVYKFDGNKVNATEPIDNNNTKETNYVKENEVWNELKGVEKFPLDATGENSFNFLVLNFDLSKLTASQFKYNAATGVYYAELSNDEIIALADYYSNFAELYNEERGELFGGFNAIALTVEEGKLTKITLFADELSATTTFTDYGTTTVE